MFGLTHFNPRAPCGARLRTVPLMMYSRTFQSTRPLRGATSLSVMLSRVMSLFQSTRPLRGATVAEHLHHHSPPFQSTRPLRGATLGLRRRQETSALFQSTRPLRGATDAGRDDGIRPQHFNPRAPCGARRLRNVVFVDAEGISIHAPLAGRDGGSAAPGVGPRRISIHAPLAGRDHDHHGIRHQRDISIHAPLAGRDSKLDEFLSANLRKSNKRDLLSEEKMRHGLPRTTCMSHFRSFFGCEAEAVFCPLALRT